MKNIRFTIKINMIFILAIILFTKRCYAESTIEDNFIIQEQKDKLGITTFIQEAKNYAGDIDIDEIFNSAIKGEISNKTLMQKVFSFAKKDFKEGMRTLGAILVIIVIHSILKSIIEGLGNKEITQIAYYVQYILIVTIIMNNFTNIISLSKDSIQELVDFINILTPTLVSVVAVTGNIVFANIAQPILLFVSTFIGNFIIKIIIPVLLASTVLSIISKISDKIQIDKLSKFFKSSIIWILTIILTVYSGIVSIEGSIGKQVDQVTAKTAKAAVSNAIPVVGKILGDTIDTVIGCGGILKNAVGIIGMFIILSICIRPIIMMLMFMLVYYLLSALVQPIADDKIIKLLEQMGDTFKVLFAILCSVSAMFIIGITIVIKVTT